MVKSSTELRQRIRIQYKIKDIDSSGHPTEAWKDFGATSLGEQVFRYARWQWLHGNEFYKAAAINAQIVAEVTINYVYGLKTNMRVIYNDTEYEVIPPIDNILEQNRFIVFKVKTLKDG